jgi:F420-0:gamma-glutamyl ligase
MGETNEGRPVVVVEGASDLIFQNRVPTSQEIEDIAVSRQEDIYGVIVNSVNWQKGEAEPEKY